MLRASKSIQLVCEDKVCNWRRTFQQLVLYILRYVWFPVRSKIHIKTGDSVVGKLFEKNRFDYYDFILPFEKFLEKGLQTPGNW